MKIVKFIRPNSPYNAGEMAGFDEEKATKFVKAGVAVYFEKMKDGPDKNKMISTATNKVKEEAKNEEEDKKQRSKRK